MADDAEVIKAGAQGIVEGVMRPFSDLIQTLFGPAAEEAGQMLQDHVRTYRLLRQVRLWEQTQRCVAKRGIKPRQVPLKLLGPIIENASVEDDDNLQDIWANLLANAANPDETNKVYPSFPAILKELTARDVKFLDELFTTALELAKGQHHTLRVDQVVINPNILSGIYSKAGLAPHQTGRDLAEAESRLEASLRDLRDMRLSIDTYGRHGIIAKVYETPIREESRNIYALGMAYSFTSLGACFVTACRRP